jgi:hypothetical protein
MARRQEGKKAKRKGSTIVVILPLSHEAVLPPCHNQKKGV